MLNPFPVSSAAREIFDEISRDAPRLPLTCGSAKASEALNRLRRLSDSELLGSEIGDVRMAQCVRAGLLLRSDQFEESHAISQNIDTPEGSYWHGILHRREPDASNAKYWFRGVGSHPLFAALATPPEGTSSSSAAVTATALSHVLRDGLWDPIRFVDLCASAGILEQNGNRGGEQRPTRAELEDLQELEIRALLRYCYSGAVNGPMKLRRDA